MKFQEYLDAKKNLVDKPPTELIGDYNDEPTTKPENPTDAKGNKVKEPSAPYSNPKKDKTHTPEKGGLAGEGDKKLIYEPDTSTDGVYGKKFQLKSPMAEWIRNNKDLPLDQWISKVSNNKILETSNKKIPNDPTEAIKAITTLCKVNENFASLLVREMKKQNCVKKLLGEMMKHNETYQALAKLLKEDKIFNRLDQAVNEEVSPPFDDEDETLGDEGEGDPNMDSAPESDEEGDSEGLDMGDDSEGEESDEEGSDLEMSDGEGDSEEPDMENDDFDSEGEDDDETGFKDFKSRMADKNKFRREPEAGSEPQEDYFK